MFNKKISANFTRWGEKTKKLPDNNEALKQKILDSLQPVHEIAKKKKPFAFRWLFLTAVPALALFLTISVWQNSRIESLSSVESVDFYEGEQAGQTASYDANLGLSKSIQATGLAQEESFVERIADKISMPEPEPMIGQPSIYYYNESSDITDTREYLKTTFGLNIKTRNVEKMHTRLKTIIRGYDGRIDNANLNEKYASIGFVLPKSAYESFVEEVTEMFPEKFITVYKNSTNLLGQKQNIEKQTEYTSSTLENLKTERADNIKKYDEKIASLNKEISRLDNSMYALVAQRKTVSSTDTETLKKINDQINYLSRVRTERTSELMRAMTQHEKDLDYFDNQIKNTENNLIELGKQDTKLINNVETVNGTITIRWISLFQIVNLYIPIYKTLITVCILIIIGYIFLGRKTKEIELP
ncbi:MAG TPA: hypothetical protein P5230_03125 [Candidatus Magasanikbacteria bacterium]|nr:hypothetical protein [Candidatus Magasanikbacteria bacterium]